MDKIIFMMADDDDEDLGEKATKATKEFTKEIDKINAQLRENKNKYQKKQTIKNSHQDK